MLHGPVPSINSEVGTGRSGDDAARPHHVPTSPPAATKQPTSAINRNPHSRRTVTRGFVPRRLSYACRRPKLFTLAAGLSGRERRMQTVVSSSTQVGTRSRVARSPDQGFATKTSPDQFDIEAIEGRAYRLELAQWCDPAGAQMRRDCTVKHRHAVPTR